MSEEQMAKKKGKKKKEEEKKERLYCGRCGTYTGGENFSCWRCSATSEGARFISRGR